MSDLCELAIKYNVDKCPAVYHTYTPHYHTLLNPMRNTAGVVVEIGVGNIPLMQGACGLNYRVGASLFMWRDYFPNANIVGCDILPESMFNDQERIETHIVDQSDANSLTAFRETLKSKYTEVDVILDDGSHVEVHQTLSFRILWDLLKNGGIYIIEDTFESSIERFINLRLPNAEVAQVYHGKKVGDDNFVAFRKAYFPPNQ